MSTALTEGIRISVETEFLPERSRPSAHQFAFSYTVTITNEGEDLAQLLSRHWIITDNTGGVREVQGDGVVGEQPVLRGGESFRYTSWCVLPTPSGSMKGLYNMVRKNRASFKAEIPAFRLGMPDSLN